MGVCCIMKNDQGTRQWVGITIDLLNLLIQKQRGIELEAEAVLGRSCRQFGQLYLSRLPRLPKERVARRGSQSLLWSRVIGEEPGEHTESAPKPAGEPTERSCGCRSSAHSGMRLLSVTDSICGVWRCMPRHALLSTETASPIDLPSSEERPLYRPQETLTVARLLLRRVT
ncbi:hypothetical protein NDU88_006231 [Pleurodeles waltl]|uniref:Uncharacterized protein n=1 Tax=Pleurodeles waltl TaxID=8319 RepID=A0AAV7VNL0_PLEWA|nr:hypothetical protein NDU88_006231 [Pleurodeles waltl]